MRPRKRILLIDTHPDKRGELKFVLEVCGYRVIQHARGQIDLILVHWPFPAMSCTKLKESNPDTPLLIIAPVSDQMPIVQSADMVMWESAGRAVILGQVKTFCARKRGPKKKDVASKTPATERIGGNAHFLEREPALRRGVA